MTNPKTKEEGGLPAIAVKAAVAFFVIFQMVLALFLPAADWLGLYCKEINI